jgi:hypothetical protein
VVNGSINLPANSITSTEIADVNASKISGPGVIAPAQLPEISQIRGRLGYGEIANTPDLSKFVTDAQLANKNYTTESQVRSIVRSMVKPNALA